MTHLHLSSQLIFFFQNHLSSILWSYCTFKIWIFIHTCYLLLLVMTWRQTEAEDHNGVNVTSEFPGLYLISLSVVSLCCGQVVWVNSSPVSFPLLHLKDLHSKLNSCTLFLRFIFCTPIIPKLHLKYHLLEPLLFFYICILYIFIFCFFFF